MKRVMSAQSNRKSNINKITHLMYDDTSHGVSLGTIEDILLSHGASEDDSDPSEGLFVSMSDEDIRQALYDIMDAIDEATSTREYDVVLTGEDIRLIRIGLENYVIPHSLADDKAVATKLSNNLKDLLPLY